MSGRFPYKKKLATTIRHGRLLFLISHFFDLNYFLRNASTRATNESKAATTDMISGREESDLSESVDLETSVLVSSILALSSWPSVDVPATMPVIE